MSNCAHCSKTFDIVELEREYYIKMEVPEPTWCPHCRYLRRLLWRNERHLFARTCDFSGDSILSMLPPESPYPVYATKVWNSDAWTPPQAEYNPERPFLEQWRALALKTPRSALFVIEETLANAQFTNASGYSKDCYMTFGAGYDEECMYAVFIDRCRSCSDGLVIANCELCYEIVDGDNCYNVQYAQDVRNCRDSAFLLDCVGCSNCFGCTNLRNKQYCLWNEQVTPEQYKEALAELDLGSCHVVKELLQKWKDFTTKHAIHRYMHGQENENSSGDYIQRTKNAHQCYDCKDIEDCRYCTSVREHAKDCYDYDYWGYSSELMYECVGSGTNSYNLKFCANIFENCQNLEYCEQCRDSSNCFGCVGIKNGKYCILNKQYDPETYHSMVESIRRSMKQDNTYGEFFPFDYSPHPYNHSVALDLLPYTKEEVEAMGIPWHVQEKTWKAATCQIPDNVKDTNDSMTKEILACQECGKNYKIAPAELAFYLQHTIPLPRSCFDCRHMARIRCRNPRTLYHRSCMKEGCAKEFDTTFPPNSPSIVYCDQCYEEAVF